MSQLYIFLRKITTILCFLLLSCLNMQAGFGYTADCGASIQLNGKTYGLGSCSSAAFMFNQSNFLSIGALTLGEIKQKTYENGADNVTSAVLHYAIYPISSTNTPVFQSINLTTITSIGANEELREANPALNLLAGLQINTDYKLEIYFESTTSAGSIFNLNNNGANYSATFKTPLILPVKFANVIVSAQGSKNQIRFSTGSENDLTAFTILRSHNGNNFSVVGTIAAQNRANGSSYVFEDVAPLNGNNYYRIIAKNLQGEETYSLVVRNFFGKIDNSLSLFPNPTVDYLKVNFISNVRGSYNLFMYNDGGQLLYQQPFNHNGSDRTISLDLPKSMKKGPYRIYISNGTDFYIGTFIVQ